MKPSFNSRLLLKFLPVFLLLFLAAATFITLNVTKKRQELRSRATTTPASLTFSPTQISRQPGETFDASVIMDTNNHYVVGADILVEFDKINCHLKELPNLPTIYLKRMCQSPVTTRVLLIVRQS